MHILKIEEIEKMIKAFHYGLEESNPKSLNYYLFLQQYTKAILANFPYTYKEVLYSQYYWFVHYKNQVEYNEGLEQQAFLLIEQIGHELEGAVDWELIEDIEIQLKKN